MQIRTLLSNTTTKDIIVIAGQDLAWRTLVARLLSLKAHRIIYLTLDYLDPRNYPVHAFLEGAFCRLVDGYITGERHRGYICKTYYKFSAPVAVIPPNLPRHWPIPPKCEKIRTKLTGGCPDAFVIMLHGKPRDERAALPMLEALSLLPRRYILASTMDPDDPRRASIEGSFGLRGRLVCLGRLEYGELFTYTVSSDCGVLLYEDTDLGAYFQGPGRLTEYLACGVPVLTNQYCGLELLTLKYGIGVAVDIQDPASIRDGILELERRGRGRSDGNSVNVRNVFQRVLCAEEALPELDEFLNAVLA